MTPAGRDQERQVEVRRTGSTRETGRRILTSGTTTGRMKGTTIRSTGTALTITWLRMRRWEGRRESKRLLFLFPEKCDSRSCLKYPVVKKCWMTRSQNPPKPPSPGRKRPGVCAANHVAEATRPD